MMTADVDHVRIHSIGTYLPDRREDNAVRAQAVGFDSEFLTDKLGVLRRSVKEPEETTSDLSIKAFEDLMARTDVPVDDIQLLVVVTQHPDFKVPYTAAIVHNRLDLSKQCMTFDISQACAGYAHALTTVVGLMNEARFEHGVLITCDPYSDKVDPDDKDTALLFGDAATATYFSRSGSGYRLIDSCFGTRPKSNQCLHFDNVLHMDGQAVFKNAVKEVPPSINGLLESNQLTVDDVDLFLLHQGSKYLVEFVGRKVGIPEGKAPLESAEYGNTVSSSIPLMLQKHLEPAQLQTLVLSGFGVGFSWGCNLLKLTKGSE